MDGSTIESRCGGMNRTHVLRAVVIQIAWVFWFLVAEFLAWRLSPGLLQVHVAGFAAGAVWALFVHRYSSFWYVAFQAALAGVANGALTWSSPCSDCLVPEGTSAVVLAISASLVTLAGLGLGWLLANSGQLVDAQPPAPRG